MFRWRKCRIRHCRGEKTKSPLSTTILGYNFSAPFLISPAAAPGAVGGYVPKDRELGLLKGAYNGDILYIPALYAEMSIEEIAEAKGDTGQVTFQQVLASSILENTILTDLALVLRSGKCNLQCTNPETC